MSAAKSNRPLRGPAKPAAAPRHAESSEAPAPRPAPRNNNGGGNRPPAAPGAIRIEQVRQVLGEVLQWSGPADLTLSRWFRAHPRVGGRDRGEIAEAVYDVLRHLRRYRQVAEGGRGAATRRLAVLGLAATLGPQSVRQALDAEEAEWLSRVLAIKPASLPVPTPQLAFDLFLGRSAALLHNPGQLAMVLAAVLLVGVVLGLWLWRGARR